MKGRTERHRMLESLKSAKDKVAARQRSLALVKDRIAARPDLEVTTSSGTSTDGAGVDLAQLAKDLEPACKTLGLSPQALLSDIGNAILGAAHKPPPAVDEGDTIGAADDDPSAMRRVVSVTHPITEQAGIRCCVVLSEREIKNAGPGLDAYAKMKARTFLRSPGMKGVTVL